MNKYIKINTDYLSIIEMKLNVPQVGSKELSFIELEDDTLYDFIIDIYGNLKTGRGHYKLNKKQKQLYFAGRLKVKDNKIIYIDNDSGHYYPSKDELEVLHIILKESTFAIDELEYKFIDLESFYTELNN